MHASCRQECDWLAQYQSRTVHSYSLLYVLLFCETHDLVCEIIRVSEKRIKNGLVKIIYNVFKKMKRWVISFNAYINDHDLQMLVAPIACSSVSQLNQRADALHYHPAGHRIVHISHRDTHDRRLTSLTPLSHQLAAGLATARSGQVRQVN